MTTQRIRAYFAKRERVRYISHLDVLRYWERAIRRADLPLSYSQGFTPHPKLQFAGPLPLGYLAEREVMDVSFDERVELDEFRLRVAGQTVPDLPLIDAEEIPLSTPPAQAAALWGDYLVEVPDATHERAELECGRFLALESLEWTEERRDRQRVYDLRVAVASLAVLPPGTKDTPVILRMRLSATPDFMVRPEPVITALFGDVAAGNITRERLLFERVSPALDAWRRKGRFEG